MTSDDAVTKPSQAGSMLLAMELWKPHARCVSHWSLMIRGNTCENVAQVSNETSSLEAIHNATLMQYVNSDVGSSSVVCRYNTLSHRYRPSVSQKLIRNNLRRERHRLRYMTSKHYIARAHVTSQLSPLSPIVLSNISYSLWWSTAYNIRLNDQSRYQSLTRLIRPKRTESDPCDRQQRRRARWLEKKSHLKISAPERKKIPGLEIFHLHLLTFPRLSLPPSFFTLLLSSSDQTTFLQFIYLLNSAEVFSFRNTPTRIL